MGQFDSATPQLKERAKVNSQNAKYDLEEWIFQQVKLHQGISVLDIGCGNGKQIFALAKLLLPNDLIMGLDISSEAIKEINQRAAQENQNNIFAIAGSIDECNKILSGKKFDLILSTYAIYYAKNFKKIILELKDLLKPKGQIFLCGPGKGTNQEMTLIINQTNPKIQQAGVSDFISLEEIKEMEKSYAKVEVARLSNQIKFSSTEEVMQWWKNHNSFVSEKNKEVWNLVQSQIKDKREFFLTKNVLGVHFYD